MTVLDAGWSEARLRGLQDKNNCFLQEWRHKQLKKFLLMGFPDRKIENWKYTDVTQIASQTFSFDRIADDIGFNIEDFIIEGTHRMVFINGYFVPALSTLTKLIPKVQLASLKAILKEKRGKIRITDNLSSQTAFSLLNGSLFRDGMFLYVPKNFQLEEPIHLLYLMKPNFPLSMTQTRHLIFLDENANASFIEEYRGVSSTMTYFNNIVTQIKVGDSANLVLYKLQEENSFSFHIANTQINQAQNSQVTACHFLLGGALGREDLHCALKGHGASCRLLGLYHPQNTQHIDSHTCVDHRVSECESQQLYKGIIGDDSKAVFNGKIFVHKGASKTIARQTNKNLIFSDKAEVNVKPEIEIYNDDVVCTHGATIGHLNDDTLFYLCSRGIDRIAAKHLLTCAFSSEIVEKLPHRIITEHLYARFTKKLGVMLSGALS
ncbi:Fe-S cluster assembly protein SufD [Coxiella endosymbiont of Amblyomma americanum]|uniref:Fe-S cluster assembly protein SufD n=1 Tax=Coxiella endosymbiont of Amblyomma americanum TaxID=325775 RepID=UPI00057E17CC|nr:Fe-S cluster assembly protein SufD [Coxiella endosymbiont of Amblyomma americanum]AJC50526.1 Fe-S cluster assembly protein SufD [Coxiella endosymbiont of Amblyomma americanum]